MHSDLTIRTMKEADCSAVQALWKTIHGFGIRTIDDSTEGVLRFLHRNPTTSIVAEYQGQIVGAILCGHDGRQGCFYHVCVREDMRRQGIGRAMATAAMRALQEEKINKVTLIAYKTNEAGNGFWNSEGFLLRDDINVYDFSLNDENIARFNA